MRTPKQLLNIVGRQTMLEQTMGRLAPLVPASRVWLVTNAEQAAAVRRQLPKVDARHILAEPVGRNTAAAIALAAAHIQHEIITRNKTGGEALMAVVPADQFIAQPARYRKIVRAALKQADRPGALVVLGIPPTRPETGYGYIEYERGRARVAGEPVYAVRRFTEKPSLQKAKRYCASGRYFWNAGMFFWRISTFLENLAKYLPQTHSAVLQLAETIGTRRYNAALRRIYPKLQNISIDYAVLEPASQHGRATFVLPAAVGWSDIGSWQSVHEMLAKADDDNVSAGRFVAVDARGNLLWSPGKFVGAVGVRNLVVVDTPDALLVCSRDRAQDVAKIVKWLETHRGRELL
jgi:mannose-1-phosphate guanylyltransferase